jgi:hypothetical protein
MIIWGTKRVISSLGFVADFCPLCREVRTFEVKRIGMAGHLYYLSFGSGTLAGYVRTCRTCGTDLNATPDQYAKLSRERLEPRELQPITFPNLEEVHRGRLALEKSLKSPLTKLNAADRVALIKEPFILLSPRVEERFASLHFDWPTGLTLLVAVVGLIFIPAMLSAALPDYAAELVMACIAAAVVAVGVQMFLSSERFMRKQLLPVLVPALQPLKPTPQELESVLKDMKSLGRRIGSKLKLRTLLAGLGLQGG